MSAFCDFANTSTWLLKTTREKIKLCKSFTINKVYVSMQYLNKNIRSQGKLTQMTNNCSNQLIKSTMESAFQSQQHCHHNDMVPLLLFLICLYFSLCRGLSLRQPYTYREYSEKFQHSREQFLLTLITTQQKLKFLLIFDKIWQNI